MNQNDYVVNQEAKDRREMDCKEEFMQENDYVSKQVTVDDLCNQRLTDLALRALKQIDISVGIEVNEGQLGIRGKLRVPLRPFLFVAALVLAGKCDFFHALLIRIVGPP